MAFVYIKSYCLVTKGQSCFGLHRKHQISLPLTIRWKLILLFLNRINHSPLAGVDFISLVAEYKYISNSSCYSCLRLFPIWTNTDHVFVKFGSIIGPGNRQKLWPGFSSCWHWLYLTLWCAYLEMQLPFLLFQAWKFQCEKQLLVERDSFPFINDQDATTKWLGRWDMIYNLVMLGTQDTLHSC